MTNARILMSRTHCCLAIVVLAGFLSLFSQAEQPEEAVKKFVNLFISQDAAGIMKIIQPDVLIDKEIRLSDVQGFLKRYHSNALKLERFTLDRRFQSEDGKTHRFQATLLFRGPSLGDRYPGPSTLKMVLIWVLEQQVWHLERPLDMGFFVDSDVAYPTQSQRELAMRFEATAKVLSSIGVPGSEDLPFIPRNSKGPAISEFKQLEKLHRRERGQKGVSPDSAGVQILLKAARCKPAGLAKLYHGDFSTGPLDKRKPVPWDVFRDYVLAAAQYGRTLEKRGNRKGAEHVYRSLIALGRLFFDEIGGVQSCTWGLRFQKLGAEGLARVLSTEGGAREGARNLDSLVSRRLDLVKTALQCLDDLSDYNSLQAAILAAQGTSGALFRPWGINTLVILGLKGAPVKRSVVEQIGSMATVLNPRMQKTALEALQTPAVTSSGELAPFVKSQMRWVKAHRVYGTAHTFR